VHLRRAVLVALSAVSPILLAPGAAVALPPTDAAVVRPSSASTDHGAGAVRPPVRLIVDTDFGQWWDDVAALAMVHAAADAGRVRILGMMSDVGNPWNAAGLDALNTWYGRPDIPIGVPRRATAVEENYSQLLARTFPHAGRAVPAVELYQRLLRGQPDHSVTILSVRSSWVASTRERPWPNGTSGLTLPPPAG
jgi:hypothetical protein